MFSAETHEARFVTLAGLRFAAPADSRARLATQMRVLRDRHAWVMTWLYVMTFGSFIGYAAAFPKLIQDVFGRLPSGAPASRAAAATSSSN